MKKIGHLLTLALAAAFVPSLAQAAELGVDGTTLFRLEQQPIPGFGKQRLAPATQFLGADLEKMGNFSLHAYGWERVDLADPSSGEKKNDGDLSYGYLNYRLPNSDADLKVGRFFTNEGVAAEQVDGVSARTRFLKGIGLSVFGGRPVKLDRGSNTKGDYVGGGRLSFKTLGLLEIGASGVQEGKVTIDETTGKKQDRQLVGGDLWFSPNSRLELMGHTFYNAATSGIAEHSYVLTVKPAKVFTFNASYNDDRLKNYFAFTNIRSLFNPDTAGNLRSYGGGFTWYLATPLEFSADYRRSHRTDSLNLETNGSSNRFGGELRLSLLENKLRFGLGYHRVQGAGGFNSYHEARGFGYYNAGKYQASLDAIGQFYHNAIYNKEQAFEVIASAGYKVLPSLTLSGDLSYGRNPRLTDEMKGLVRLTFNYQAASKGVSK